MPNTASEKMRGFGGLLTKFYLSKVVQRGTMKQGGNPHSGYVWTVTTHFKITYMTKGEIKNVVIFDGIKEYTKDEILKNRDLTAMMNAVINLGGFTIFSEKINMENGVLYITTEPNHKYGVGKLKNVSKELYFEYMDKGL